MKLLSTLLTVALTVALLSLTGCGSAKVYENRKTVVYRGEMYSVANVETFSREVTGKLSNGESVNLDVNDKKRFTSLVKEHGEIEVRMAFMFDDREMLYLASRTDRWRDFQNMARRFDKAGKEIADLMADSKATQVKLD